jgi:hypothetical protein
VSSYQASLTPVLAEGFSPKSHQPSSIGTGFLKAGFFNRPHIESFHDKFRDECLNREIFGSLLEAKVLVEQWRMEYNTNRPHSSLRYQTPQEVADRWQTALRASPCAASASTTKNINNRTELHF